MLRQIGFYLDSKKNLDFVLVKRYSLFMGRPKKKSADKVETVAIGLPKAWRCELEALGIDMGLSNHELVEAIVRFLATDLNRFQVAELLKPHVRLRNRKSDMVGMLRQTPTDEGG